MAKSKIEWTERTLNPLAGCAIVSAGCTHCYAMRMAHRLEAMGQAKYKGLTKVVNGNVVWTGKINLDENALQEPMRRRKPTMYFVDSMSDLFHENVPAPFILDVFTAMANTPQHTYQVLTKRPKRMSELMPSILEELDNLRIDHIWLGVSVENQTTADERIPLLLKTPAAVRFLSCEPLLSDIDLNLYLWRGNAQSLVPDDRLNWIICGGESGPGARPMNPCWARNLRDQATAAGVPFFFKQFGEWFPRDQWEYNPELVLPDDCDSYTESATTHVFPDNNPVHRVGKHAAGRLLDGREWNEYPEVKP